MLVVSRGGDGGCDSGGADCNSGDCNTGDCNTGDCNTGDCNTGHTGDCNTGDCNSHHTGDICQNDTNCTQNDTAYTDHACCSDGPQVNPDFGLYNCGPCDSNPSCNQYGGFMYNDPLWSSDIYAFGGGSYTAPAMPASSRGGYSSQGATRRPDWETKEWTCEALVDGRVCGHVNSPVYNPTECGECFAERPEEEQPAAAPAPANVDPLTIESAPADENDTDRKNTCCICMEKVSDIVLLGAKQGTTYACRHKCMCRQCALKLRDGPESRRKCPMCRTKVDHFAVAANLPRRIENTVFN